jgi:CxC5 like cysteine cluster associated with KDZ transposases
MTILFTLDCKINYHHNFYVEGGQRVYYDTVTDIIQVGEHQFVEWKVIDLFIMLMLVSWYVHLLTCLELVPDLEQL